MPTSPQVNRAALLLLGGAALALVLALPKLAHRNRAEHVSLMGARSVARPLTDDATFAAYAGSAACRDCHSEVYDLWRTSHHALAERPPDPAYDDAAFFPPRTFAHGSQQSTAGGSNGNYHVTTIGLSGQSETAHVARVIGHSPLRQFLVPAPGGRLQTLEASYDPHSNAWFNVYGNEDRQPGEWGHWTGRGMNWNSMCAACHNTRVRKNYDPATDHYQTTMAEMTVSCEACHGPRKAHADWHRAGPRPGQPDPTRSPMSPTQHDETCATCHARRMDLTGEFVPGDHFADHHRLSIVDGSDAYYPDGQVREENYEYAAFLGSRMGNAGIRCADCHQVHSAKLLLPGNLVCMRCHAGNGAYPTAPVIDPAAHSFHKIDPLYGKVGSADAAPDIAALAARDRNAVWASGGECVNCHMPQTTYMQRHRRHDHGQTIPDPLLTKQYGIPNACNRCHLDQPVDWALTWTEKWYGDKMNRPSRQRAQTIAAARAGDARAVDGLLALLRDDPNPYWQAVAVGMLYPWAAEPRVASALTAAATHAHPLVRANVAAALTAAPVLQRLLDDPVRAVRYAAAWSMRGELDPESNAAQELRTVLDFVADQPVGQMQNGAAAFSRGDLPQAAAHNRTAVDWDPNSAPIRHDYAIVLSMQGQGMEAAQQLEAACRLEPQNGEFRYKLALAWHEIGRTNLVLANLQEAVRLDPAHGRAWYNLGLALAAEGKLNESIPALQRAADALPGPDACYALATVYARQNNIPAARAAAARALEREANHVDTLQFLQALDAASRTK